MSASLALLAFFLVAFVGPAWHVGSQPRPARPRHASNLTIAGRVPAERFPAGAAPRGDAALLASLVEHTGASPLSSANRAILRRRMRVELAEARGREVVG